MKRRYRLQECRKKAGWKSAKAFADHIGMSARTYTNYEQEVSELTVGLAIEFAQELNCSLDELAGYHYAVVDFNDAKGDDRNA